jgi:hypothetical protein
VDVTALDALLSVLAKHGVSKFSDSTVTVEFSGSPSLAPQDLAAQMLAEAEADASTRLRRAYGLPDDDNLPREAA